MAPHRTKAGYLYVRVRYNGFHRNKMIHRLVAEAFLSTPSNPQDFMVDHINGMRADNRPGNLRWATRSENNLNRMRHDTGVWPTQQGTWQATLTVNGVTSKSRHKTKEAAFAARLEMVQASGAYIHSQCNIINNPSLVEKYTAPYVMPEDCIRLKRAIIAWNNGRSGDGKVTVLSWPDREKTCDKYSGSDGACYSGWTSLSSSERRHQLLAIAWRLTIDEGVSPSEIDRAFSVIPEYRDAFLSCPHISS